jgi:macrolide transport system ATP-binding/permease protein
MASFVKLHHIQFSYDLQHAELFSGLSLTFSTGWSSLCGVNGSGKSTLFKLISGDLTPNFGQIEKLGRISLIPQETENPPEGLESFLIDYSRNSMKLKSNLNLESEQLKRWNSLSIGERKKIQVAIALASEPDILLVDEPTNHLDEESKGKILAELKRFRGVGILISHDRLLLNDLSTSTVFIDEGKCIQIKSSYDIAKQELKRIQQEAAHTRNLKKESLKTLSRSLQHQSEKVAQGQKKISKRGVDKKDHDTKAKINLARLTGADLADSRKKRVLEERSERISTELSNLKVKKEYKLGVFFGEISCNRRLHIAEDIWQTPFLKILCPEIVVEPGQHIAITGLNGVGKSTFLSLWLKQLSSYPVKYAKQEITYDEKKHLMDDFAQMDAESKGKIFTLVSCFGSDPKSPAEGGIPSPGVWQKIIIAKAIVQGAPFLFLDEPTNHMDLAALEVLEEALRLYQGTLILISHDRSFINKVCTREFVLTKQNQTVTINQRKVM